MNSGFLLILFFALFYFKKKYIFTFIIPETCYKIVRVYFGVLHNTCQVSRTTLGASKNVKFQLFRNSMKFDMVARFLEMISMVKSVLSSEI